VTGDAEPDTTEDARLSDELQGWLASGDTTLGGLLDLFGPKSFAVMFVVLMAVPALPLPTGGATHVFEILVIIGAAQLIVGRSEIWIPRRWRATRLGGTDGNSRFVRALIGVVRVLERIARPRMAPLFDRRPTMAVFGVLVVVGALGAFLAPPFTGLDTLPALGVMVMSLGVLMEDMLIVVCGVVIAGAGIAVEVALAGAAISLFSRLL
jgi:hypothetical protein